MNIAFLDDDKQCLKRLTRLAKDIIDKNNVYDFSFNYFEYDNPVEFLKEHKEKKFDAVFLDIEMPQVNGMIVGDEAFKINHDIFIFYTTSFSNYAVSTIKHRVYRFIDKGDKIELEESIKQMLNDIALFKSNYIFSYDKEKFIIPAQQILYFEKRHNVVDIITEKETFIQRISMKELEQNLSNIKFFCRCHSAYIVNLRNIKKFTDKYIIMNNDAQISVSKKYHANLIRKLALIF